MIIVFNTIKISHKTVWILAGISTDYIFDGNNRRAKYVISQNQLRASKNRFYIFSLPTSCFSPLSLGCDLEMFVVITIIHSFFYTILFEANKISMKNFFLDWNDRCFSFSHFHNFKAQPHHSSSTQQCRFLFYSSLLCSNDNETRNGGMRKAMRSTKIVWQSNCTMYSNVKREWINYRNWTWISFITYHLVLKQ